ncbi:hypothetical protein acdb102_12370 [Acidothermaceae bacterium B102]|nr:hypothetical protein acdb102_12370 [Acidothermaceae bacterium B102]
MFAKGIGFLDEQTIRRVLTAGARLQLGAQPTSARRARAFVREQVDVRLMDNAELAASELVTNGVLHARTELTLGIVPGDECVLIAVTDDSAERPSEQEQSMSAEGGRGIALVATIARSWGVQAQDSGKIIWCLIDAEPLGVA